MQEIPGQAIPSPSTRQFTYNQNARFYTLPSSRSGLGGTNPITAESKEGRKGIFATVWLQLDQSSLSSLQISDFLASFKRFSAQRGRPEITYSNNGSTFKAAAKWLQKVHKDERCHAFLAENSKWKFNLSHATWWGGQFESLIGLFKNAFYKSIGNGMLGFPELEEVVLDVEVALNNQPLRPHHFRSN